MAAIHVNAWARPNPAAIPTQELPTTQSTCVRTRSRRRSWRWRLASAVGGVEGMCSVWSHGLAEFDWFFWMRRLPDARPVGERRAALVSRLSFVEGFTLGGGVVGVEVFGQEFVYLFAGLEGQWGVHAVEVVAAGSVVVDLVVELFAFCFEGLDEVFDFEVVDVFVVGVGVDEERGVELGGVGDGGALAVLGDVVVDVFAEVVGCGVELAVGLGLVAHAGDEVADGDARVGYGVVVGVGEDVHEGDEAAVAPADDADALGVEEAVALEHELHADVDVVDLTAAVVDLLVEGGAITGAAAIINGDDGVALLEEFADEVGVDGGVERGVDALVDEDDEGLFAAVVEVFGDKGVAVEEDGVRGAGSFFVLGVLVGWAGVLVFVDVGDVAEFLIPEEIVDAFEDDVGVSSRCGEGLRDGGGGRSGCGGRSGGGAGRRFLREGEAGEKEHGREEVKRRREGAACGWAQSGAPF